MQEYAPSFCPSEVYERHFLEVFLTHHDVSVFHFILAVGTICYGLEAMSIRVLRLACKSVKVVCKVCAYYGKYEKYAGVCFTGLPDY